MHIGLLTLELSIGGAMSLKDRRRAVKSVKDRLAHRFNISIAEVGELSIWTRATLAVAMVSNDPRYVEGALHKIVDFVRANGNVDLDDFTIEFL